MKIHEALKVLAMMDKDDDVELHFPNAFVPTVPTVPKLTEGEMASLPWKKGDVVTLGPKSSAILDEWWETKGNIIPGSSMDDPCPTCRPGITCRTPACGRLAKNNKTCKAS